MKNTKRVIVKEVVSAKERRAFACFNADFYADNPNAIPDIVSDEYDTFIPKKNPAYEFCETIQFLAYYEGEKKPVGRIAGIINKAANEKWERSRVRFSRVDFVDDTSVSQALFTAVEEWGKSKGMNQIQGPIGFCDMDQEGMLIEGYDKPGMLITIYNAPYYKEHMETLGYTKSVDWVEKRIMMPEKPLEKMNKLSQMVLKKFKLTLIEPKKRKQLAPYIKDIFKLLNVAYEDLYGTVELTPGLIKKYYDQFIILVNPNYVKLIYDENNEIAGFGLAMPSMNNAVKKHNGRLLPFGFIDLLLAPYRKTEVLDLYLVGVMPKWKDKGLTAVLMDSMVTTALSAGIKYAETGPELEENKQVQAMWKFFDVEEHKRRRCWIKDI
ncbi:MAG: hypothetical protein E7299_07475 [Lachnospiraceae bacterium]|nr:hypothetical protein [Lachnospiraceae bacterium]